MTRIKKSRKVNNNGPTRPAREKASARKKPSKKAGKGQASGSRHSLSKAAQARLDGGTGQDPRKGSKKPVALFVDQQTPAQPAPLAPEVELAQLESDPRLNLLLERTEAGETLKPKDQQWLDATLDRLGALMQQLGLDEEEAPEHDTPMDAEDDLLARFEQGEAMLDNYKD
ncbi:Der GTPase-activating protein YihI [Ferrimonas balearica]|uniref:Der GTPase-activating protein YihI n=1 Tax=Ferrimonas balearica TaxID=44012 RepID=UPI001C99DBD3|nr:Der GTPase-activating protein YihI [Ferrimonas balearica]MBY5993384.1 GTPase-activating protein [Ferrimonas balearica]